ncbi:hypothetical protein J2I47_20095 [Fibrella sp. HMF5335]|uniref:Uncharacterized protein n=1 Tax=Fibrella rubiginis TaxID=2817060 RepID=A0A939GL83_9BACT|nr:hypothetical protein [Fibrella rubiginis]MBO0938865.1 hypothetical protein [Fibrella rubiginis]
MLRPFIYLSLPVVLGAVFSNRFAARLSDVDPVHWATTPLLAIVVWAIYTADRLLDVRKPQAPTTGRHRFHAANAELLWGVVGGALAVGAILVFFLPGTVVRFGAVLGAICVVYVLGVSQVPNRSNVLVLKEPLVAVLFTAGIWGSVWVQRAELGWPFKAEAALFLGIAFQNILLFSVYEQRESAVNVGPSLATYWGAARCEAILRWLAFVIVAGALMVCFTADDSGGGARFTQRSSLMLAIMGLVLYAIQRYPGYFGRQGRYRFFADAVFWLPVLVL